jgi:hypothetical protein
MPAQSFVYEQLRVVGAFTKDRDDTDILLIWNSHVDHDGRFANWQLRIDGNAPAGGAGANAIALSANPAFGAGAASAANLTALFRGLAAGSHEITIWVRSETTTQTRENNGNYTRQVLVEESLARAGN